MGLLEAFAVTLLSASTIAAPLASTSQTGINDPYYKWQITGWSAGCVRSGCYYDFNVTGSEFGSNPTLPAFSAYCSGYNVGAPFYPCKNIDGSTSHGVAAKLLPAEVGEGANIAVSYQFTVENIITYYNYTGNSTATYNQFVAPLEAFTITPTEAWGVA